MLSDSLKKKPWLFSTVIIVCILVVLAAVTVPAANPGSRVLACKEPGPGQPQPEQPIGRYAISIISFSGGLGSSSTKHYYTSPITLSGNVSASNFIAGLGAYSIQVNWGDGATSNAPSNLQMSQSFDEFTGTWGPVNHIYASSGNYSITASLIQNLQMLGGSISPVATMTLEISVVTVDHIVITPKTSTLTAGQSQNYAIEAFDSANNSFGIVTSATYFGIDNGAGGSWMGGSYTSSKPGSWTVTANYQSKTDTASLTVSDNSVNNVVPTPDVSSFISKSNYLTIDFLGAVTKGLLSDDGTLANTLVAMSPDGAHTIQFPAGTKIVDSTGLAVTSLEVREADQIFQLPSGLKIVGNAYDFKPSGSVLGKPMTLTLGYNVDQLPSNLATVSLAFYGGGTTWTDLSTMTGSLSGTGKIMASIQHFSTFAVLAKILPASFNLSDLTITTSPPNGTVFFKRNGQEAVISALVTNAGGQVGIDEITLKLNGIERETKNINLAPGQSQEVTFAVTKIAAGNYSVELNERTGRFSSRIIINWLLISGLALLLLIVTGIIIIISRRLPRNSS